MKYSNENALRLVWLLIKNNFKLFLSLSGVFAVLMFLELMTVSNIGSLLGVVFSILVFSTMLYIGYFVSKYDSEDEIIQKFKNLHLKEVLTDKLVDGIGVWLGFFIVFLILSIILGIIAGVLSLFGNFGYIISGMIVVSILFLMFFAYPALMGEIIYLKGFGDSFKNVFKIFNINFWKNVFTSNYVFFSFVWSLVIGSLIGIIMIFFIIGFLSIIMSVILSINTMNTYGMPMDVNSVMNFGYIISSLLVSIVISILVLFLNFYAGVSFSFAHSILSEKNENIISDEENIIDNNEQKTEENS